jgi:predicted  nucleic acid-binding Zn-ribbon protein
MRQSFMGVDPRSFRALLRHREQEQSDRVRAALEEERRILARIEMLEERYAKVEAEMVKIEAAERAARERYAAPVRKEEQWRADQSIAHERTISAQEDHLATLHAVRGEVRTLDEAARADVAAVIARLEGETRR